MGKAVRRAWWISASALPSASASAEKPEAGAVLSRSVFGPQRVECQVPPVDGASQLFTDHREIGVQLSPAGYPAPFDPTEQLRHILYARRVERGMHLDIEVVAELESPEELQDRCVAQHH